RIRKMPATGIMAGRNAIIASSADMAAATAITAIMAIVPVITTTASKTAQARIATRRPTHRSPQWNPYKGSQTASEMLHSSSARTSRAVTPAFAGNADAIGRQLDGEGRTAGVRRYSDRGSAGRKFPGEARQRA